MARARLTAMGAETSLTAAELRSLGDAYYNAGRYAEAAEQYRALARNMALPGRAEPQRLCGGRGGLRFEAEAADRAEKPRRCRIRTTRTARGGFIC